MNIRLKLDKTNIKIGYDGRIECLENKNDSAREGFVDFNLSIPYMAYQLFPPGIKNFFNPISSAVGQYLNRKKQTGTYESIEGKSGIIPATGNDVYNYIARYGMANFQIQAVMKLDGSLDPDKLKEAVRLSIDTEPVFGCRFIENQPPYWKPREDIDNTEFCTFEKTNNTDEAVYRFLESPLNMDHDPMVKLRLISSGNQDTLCVKINHTCCDGTGAKEYIQLLSEIYSCITRDNSVYVPNPRPRSRKDQDRLFDTLGIKDPESVGEPLKDTPRTMWPFPWRPGKPESARVAVCKLPEGNIGLLARYAKAKGATINDLIVAALYRAMYKMSQPLYCIPMDISMTVDLRRYLPDKKTEAIRNFSGGFNTRLARIPNEPFDGTLSRVIAMMDKVKNDQPGLLSAVGLERVENGDFNQTTPYYRFISQIATPFSSCIPLCSPVLSNLGVLDKSLFRFGDNTATDVYIVPPALCAPGILLCIGTYNDVMTMSVSYYKSQVSRRHIYRLLNLVKKELMCDDMNYTG